MMQKISGKFRTKQRRDAWLYRPTEAGHVERRELRDEGYNEDRFHFIPQLGAAASRWIRRTRPPARGGVANFIL